MTASHRKSAFALFASLSACAAAYHVAAVSGALPDDASPMWRHAIFAGIDSIGIWYLLKRPVALLPVFILFVAQQFVSHGHRAILWWIRDGRIDTISIITVTALSMALPLLVLDARDRSPRVRRIVCPFGKPPESITHA